jgi:hypothetical protein
MSNPFRYFNSSMYYGWSKEFLEAAPIAEANEDTAAMPSRIGPRSIDR